MRSSEPSEKGKTLLVSEVKFDEEGVVVSCCIEAVMSKRSTPIDWRDLKNKKYWINGWK